MCVYLCFLCVFDDGRMLRIGTLICKFVEQLANQGGCPLDRPQLNRSSTKPKGSRSNLTSWRRHLAGRQRSLVGRRQLLLGRYRRLLTFTIVIFILGAHPESPSSLKKRGSNTKTWIRQKNEDRNTKSRSQNCSVDRG